MNNYEYIIASLPQISRDTKSEIDFDDIKEQIHSQLSEKDLALCRILENGFIPENLDRDFYVGALENRNVFIREYFRYDLLLRNCKVRFINSELGRPLDQDVLDIAGWEESDDRPEIQRVFSGNDLLERERALDNLVWKKSDNIALTHIFDIVVVLSFLAKLNIVQRWMTLDADSGKAMFRRLIDELKESYTI